MSLGTVLQLPRSLQTTRYYKGPVLLSKEVKHPHPGAQTLSQIPEGGDSKGNHARGLPRGKSDKRHGPENWQHGTF